MNRLSGDQKGKDPSSVAGIGSALVESSGRIHKLHLPSFIALKTTRRPSGEMVTLSSNVVSAGVARAKRAVRCVAGSRRKAKKASMATARSRRLHKTVH